MSVTLFDFHPDIFTTLFSYLNIQSRCSFYHVSKTARNIILAYAEPKDFDLEGKNVFHKCEDSKSLCLLMMKVEQFASDPKFFRSLKQMTTQSAFEKPKDVLALLAYHSENYVQMQTLVVFDWTTKKFTGEDLSVILHDTVLNVEDDEESKADQEERAELIEAVFTHPHADEIAENALASILGQAIYEENHAFIERIFSHPKAKEIFWVGGLLHDAILAKNHYAIEKLLKLPNTKNIPVYGPERRYGLVGLLNAAGSAKMHDVVDNLLQLPSARKIPESRLLQLVNSGIIPNYLLADCSEPPLKRRRTD